MCGGWRCSYRATGWWMNRFDCLGAHRNIVVKIITSVPKLTQSRNVPDALQRIWKRRGLQPAASSPISPPIVSVCLFARERTAALSASCHLHRNGENAFSPFLCKSTEELAREWKERCVHGRMAWPGRPVSCPTQCCAYT